jgi:PAS domain S-box-containing protein
VESRIRELEDALERERAFGHAVTDAIHCPLFVVDAAGAISFGGVNVAAEELFGRREEELVGERFAGAIVAPDDRSLAEAWLAADGGTGGEVELRCVAGDGSLRIVTWMSRRLDAALEPRYLLVGLDVTDWRRQEEELRASRARLVEAADAERRRLERNLHDGAQQRLVALSLSLRLAESRLRDQPEAAAVVAGLRAELLEALDELRELAHGLHPAVLTHHGLTPALEGIAARVPIPVDVDVSLAERLPEAAEVAAYYVVAESLTNVQKYAGAQSAAVAVSRADGVAHVEVRDDGVGGADAAGGSGLRGLADRVEALGGRLAVESPPGRGTRVVADIPL